MAMCALNITCRMLTFVDQSGDRCYHNCCRLWLFLTVLIDMEWCMLSHYELDYLQTR